MDGFSHTKVAPHFGDDQRPEWSTIMKFVVGVISALFAFYICGFAAPQKPYTMGIERVGIAMLAFKYMNKDNSIELVPVNDSYSLVRHEFEVMEDFPDTTRMGWFIMKKVQNIYQPTHMQGNGSFCSELRANRPVMRALGITTETMRCPVKKGKYKIPDFYPNIDALPSDLKAGTQWRLASTWYVVKAPIYRFYVDIFLDEVNSKDPESL